MCQSSGKSDYAFVSTGFCHSCEKHHKNEEKAQSLVTHTYHILVIGTMTFFKPGIIIVFPSK